MQEDVIDSLKIENSQLPNNSLFDIINIEKQKKEDIR